MKRILIGCERSGVIRNAFRSGGFDAWSCDLEPAEDGSLFHLQYSVLLALRDFYWDAFIVHPPCTFLNIAGMHWTVRGLRDPNLTTEAIRFAEKCWAANVPFVALENPVGVLSTRSKLGKPTQTIQPYQFGEDASKRTCLWLRGLPKLSPTRYIKPRMVCARCGQVDTYKAAFARGCSHCGAEAGLLQPRWGNQTNSGQNKLGPSKDRAYLRAKTYPGIAAAMVQQWGQIINRS